MRRILLICAALLLVTQAAWAQGKNMVPELRPFAGAYLPTGDQRDVLKDSALMGIQFGYELPSSSMHLVGSVGWTPSKAKALSRDNKVDLYQYDLGAELFNSRPMSGEWLFRPFIGAGAGARTYHMTELKSIKAKTYPSGYAALGSEFQLTNLALRLEGRDYLSQFKGLSGKGDSKTRNDVMLAAALAFHFQ